MENVRVIDISVNGPIFSVELQVLDKSTAIMTLSFIVNLSP